MYPTFKVVLIGAGESGKTAFLQRHKTGDFEKKYIATLGTQVEPLTFHTNYGPVILNVWDCAGQEKFGGSRDGYYLKSDAAIAMFSRDSIPSLITTLGLLPDLTRIAGEIPVVLVGNKVDVDDPEVKSHHIPMSVKGASVYYDVSALSNYNFEKPFLFLVRTLMNKRDLKFVAQACPHCGK